MSASPFGRYLREQRVASGVSLRELADHLQVSHVFLGEVERGRHRKLPEKYWGRLVAVLPTVTLNDLQSLALESANLDERFNAMNPSGQTLMRALARRIEQDPDLKTPEWREIVELLGLSEEE
jgi:transcriptional regulator with XRE-family HTH domain